MQSPPLPRFEPKRFLVTTDFSVESRIAFPLAVNWATRFGSEIDLIHVWEPPPRFAGSESVILLPDPQETRSQLISGLSTLGETYFPASIPVLPHLFSGHPIPQILRAAEDFHSNLIIMATHGYGGIRHFLLGSVTERVIRRSACPVLSVPGHPSKGTEPIPAIQGPILLTTDFSEASRHAFPCAVSLAQTLGLPLRLLHVVQRFPVDALLGTEITRNTADLLCQNASAELAHLVQGWKQLSGLRVETHVSFGHPAAEIQKAAKAFGAGLLVLATHGHTGLRHAYLGSVAERVVQQAGCPVLVVPAGLP